MKGMPLDHPKALEERNGPEWAHMLKSNGKQTTPSFSSGAIRKFAKQLVGAEAKALFIDVLPIGDAQGCHLNARVFARAHEAAVVHGWVIWQGPGYIEAEFHSAVEKAGTVFCVTKQKDAEQQLLFVADPSRKCRISRAEGDLYIVESFFNVPAASPKVHARTHAAPGINPNPLVEYSGVFSCPQKMMS